MQACSAARICAAVARTPLRHGAWRPRPAQQQRRASSGSMAAVASSLPAFFPPDFAAEVEEPAAQEMMRRMQRLPLEVPSLGVVQTAFVGPDTPSSGGGSDQQPRPAFVLLHGFDSSSLEFRRFHPLLSRLGDVWAVDLAGWGFSDCGFGENPELGLGPAQKRAHLRTFLQAVVGRPVTLVGTSLGGAVAIDYALSHPADVEKLVLIDAQGFIDGIGPMSSAPRFLAKLGVSVLRAEWLREAANQMAYHNQERFATPDAMHIGRLHTHLPGWADANVAFMRSGGYSLSTRIPEVSQPTLVVWGRQDKILDPKYAAMFMGALPGARLVWVEECGHCSHLEQPQQLLQAVQEFVSEPAVLAGAA